LETARSSIAIITGCNAMKSGRIDTMLLLLNFNQGIFFEYNWAVLGLYLSVLGYSGLVFGVLVESVFYFQVFQPY